MTIDQPSPELVDRRFSAADRRRLLHVPLWKMAHKIGKMSSYDIGRNRRFLLGVLAARLDAAVESVVIANAYVAAKDGMLHGTIWADVNSPVCCALRDLEGIELDRRVDGLRFLMPASAWSGLEEMVKDYSGHALITFGNRPALHPGRLRSPAIDLAYPLLSRAYPVAFAAMLQEASSVYTSGPIRSVSIFGSHNISLPRNGMADDAGEIDWAAVETARFRTRHGSLVFRLGFGEDDYGVVVHDTITAENGFYGPAEGLEPIGGRYWRLAETALRHRSPPILPGTAAGALAEVEPFLNAWCFGPDMPPPEAAPETVAAADMTFDAG